MADEQQPETPADGTPKIFRSMTGVIGGLTALVVAVGGLFTAYDKFLRKEPAAETAPGGAAAPAASVAQDTPSPAPQKVRHSYTTGDGGKLEWVGGMWVWTDGEGNEYRYSEESNDGVTIFGKMLEDGQYVWLQWPVAGGQALQSFDNQDNWTKPIKVTVADPPADEG